MVKFRQIKIISIFLSAFLLVGCEGFKITGMMCDSIQPGDLYFDECRAYNEQKAKEASIINKKDSNNSIKKIEYKN